MRRSTTINLLPTRYLRERLGVILTENLCLMQKFACYRLSVSGVDRKAGAGRAGSGEKKKWEGAGRRVYASLARCIGLFLLWSFWYMMEMQLFTSKSVDCFACYIYHCLLVQHAKYT